MQRVEYRNNLFQISENKEKDLVKTRGFYTPGYDVIRLPSLHLGGIIEVFRQLDLSIVKRAI